MVQIIHFPAPVFQPKEIRGARWVQGSIMSQLKWTSKIPYVSSCLDTGVSHQADGASRCLGWRDLALRPFPLHRLSILSSNHHYWDKRTWCGSSISSLSCLAAGRGLPVSSGRSPAGFPGCLHPCCGVGNDPTRLLSFPAPGNWCLLCSWCAGPAADPAERLNAE